MVRRGRKPLGIVPLTAAERQQVERQRNRRAREAVVGLASFAVNANEWEEQRELSRDEILNTLFLLSKWAIEGHVAEDEWRLTLSPDRRAYVSKTFERLNLQLPFCSSCGAVLRRAEGDEWQRCECRRGTSEIVAR